MSLKLSKIYFGFLVVALVFASTACGASQVSTPTAAEVPIETPTSIVMPTTDIQSASSTPPIIQVTPTATEAVVTVTAVNGDLSIRTGPDISFDAIAALKDGETVRAMARSIMDGWLQIPIPSQEGKTGWISLKTDYFIVSGNVLDLPRVDAVEWNIGSYLINCTPHRMLVQPGEIMLQPVGDSPNNRVWFSPGLYSVYDLDVTGQPVAANLSVTEHREFHILKDGNRKQWDCPVAIK